MDFVEKGTFNPEIKLEVEDGQLFLYMTCDKSQFNQKNKLVTTGLLGKTIITKQYFETTGGYPITIDKDFFGITRKKKHPMAGPFENIKHGANRIRIW